MDEARLRETEHGLVPEGDGWFIVNPRDLAWETIPGSGTWCGFEAPEEKSRSIGIGMHVLQPGEASAMYHAEDAQEGFMILEGECLLVVEGEERLMQQWDYFHCPPGTEHITVGAGDGPCAILMLGARIPGRPIRYPVNEVAAKYGASVEQETTSPSEAYAGSPPPRPARAPWPR
jgi:uncharacterized cupin superfamily protein